MAEHGVAEAQDSEPEKTTDLTLVQAQARVGGTLRDKWRLDVLLGVGGMAAVYAATHRNGSRVAVKILHKEMSTNAFVRERFLWEGYIANAVAHDGAVKVIDDDTAEDGSLFLVTELLDGETLEERRIRSGGRLPESEVLVATDQVLDVLVAAHRNGIVHRDLKPENVFLTRTGQIKVLDFGIARLRELSTSSSTSQSGGVVGTPAYMAPEHARGLSDEVDERSDLWACGASMFTLLSGRSVHAGRTVDEQLASATTQPASPLWSVAPDVGAPVASVVDRALEFSKEQRWPSAEAMQEALRKAYQYIHGHPIAAAARLTLDEGIPDRTRPRQPGAGPAPDRRGPTTTSRPVASSDGPFGASLSPRARKTAVAVGSAAALVFAVLGIAWRVPAAPPSMRTQVARPSAWPTMPAAPPASTPAVALAPLDAPQISATESSTAKPRPQRSAGRRSATPAASGSSANGSTRPDCQPPYVVDGSGKQRWKLECL